MIRRFRGTLAASVALVLALGVWYWQSAPEDPPDAIVPDAIFRFDKEDLVAFSIDRPDGKLSMRKGEDGQWTVDGESFRPNRAMIRRVAHQLHDLTSRADILGEEAASDPSRYGLGEGAIEVDLTLADGTKHHFLVGDPNPTGVSHYLQVLDEGKPGRIYVVKKSASDFWRNPVDAFREDRITTFDADEVERLDASIDGREIVIIRTDHRKYQQLAPIEQPAGREPVRMMLGRISALRAVSFVADQPKDLAVFGLDPPAHRVAVTLTGGETVTVLAGPDRPKRDDLETRLVYLVEDQSVYEVKDGFLSSFRISDAELRDKELVGKHEWDAVSMQVTVGGESIVLSRTSDAWRWEDSAAVPGSTPKRVAGRAAEIEAIAFHDGVKPEEGALQYGLTPPWAVVGLSFQDGSSASIALGARWEEEAPPRSAPPARPGEPPEPPRPEKLPRQYARVGEGPVVTIDGSLAESIEDLVREHGRREQRQAEKGLDLP